MDEGLISRRYAKALLKFAQDRGTTDQIYEEVKKFEENFVSHPELQKALLNPVLSAKDKESLLAAAVGVAPGEDYLRFVRLVIHNRREAYIRSIYLMYQELYRELKQIAQVRIITAMELNEEASNVSQGQKQLLTIARAILADNPILILDEATSSVDTRTEVRIQKALDNLMRGRTSFIIAHRLSTIRNADLILVMKDGDIIEQGTHEQLLVQKGFYADLYNSQFEENA